MFTLHHNPDFLTSDLITVPHGFSARGGGVSEGVLRSLNLGIHRGDARENVEENYRIFGAAAGFDPGTLVFTRQTHTDIVMRVGRENCGEGLRREVLPERDGTVTNEEGVTLVCFSADCTPVLLHDPVTHAIAAVHSGWRGTAAGIVRRAVEKMTAEFGTEPENLEAAIGPCIGKCCFETDRDVPDAMFAALGDAAAPAVEADGNGKYHVDLKELNRIWLARAGVAKIDVCPACTACEPDRFWSHRRAGNARGSLAAVITLKTPEKQE